MTPPAHLTDGRWDLDSPEALRRLWPGARFTQLGGGPFRASVLRRTLLRSRIEGVAGTPYSCDRTPDLVEQHPSDLLAVNVVVTGALTMTQGPQTFTAVPGDVFLHRTGAFRFECPEPGRTFRTVVGADLLLGASGDRFRPFGTLPQSALTDAFSRFAHEILRSGADGTPLLTRTARQLEQALLVLQKALIGEVLEREQGTLAPYELLHLRALEVIEQSLADPALDASTIASRLGVSRRLLFTAFESQPESVAVSIRRRRVEAAIADLDDHPDLTVAELAERNGFRSADTFGHVFRGHRGQSVSAYRASRARLDAGGE